ncbi:unnamed protein product [Closterium sp. NIES-54]
MVPSFSPFLHYAPLSTPLHPSPSLFTTLPGPQGGQGHQIGRPQAPHSGRGGHQGCCCAHHEFPGAQVGAESGAKVCKWVPEYGVDGALMGQQQVDITSFWTGCSHGCGSAAHELLWAQSDAEGRYRAAHELLWAHTGAEVCKWPAVRCRGICMAYMAPQSPCLILPLQFSLLDPPSPVRPPASSRPHRPSLPSLPHLRAFLGSVRCYYRWIFLGSFSTAALHFLHLSSFLLPLPIRPSLPSLLPARPPLA